MRSGVQIGRGGGTASALWHTRQSTQLFGRARRAVSATSQRGVLLLSAEASLLVIYFQIYWHYWLVRFTGGQLGNTLIPIAVLLTVMLVVVGRHALAKTPGTPNFRALKTPIWLLSAYVAAACCSLLINEHDANDLRRYAIYVFSPPAILVSIVGIYGARGSSGISRPLKVLLIGAVLLSMYAVIIYNFRGGELLEEMYSVDGSATEVVAESGGTVETADLRVRRLTIPGISSTTYAPMIVPVTLLLLAVAAGRTGVRRLLYGAVAIFLSACVFMSLSRVAILGLVVGILFLLWKRVLLWRVVLPVAVVIVAAQPHVAWAALVRVAAGFAPLVSSDLGWQMAEFLGVGEQFGEDPHLSVIPETFGFIAESPFFGIGPVSLIAQQASTFGKDHNNYLSIGASFGLFALAFYVLFLVSLLFRTLRAIGERAKRDEESRFVGAGLAAGFLSILVYLNGASAEHHFMWVWFGLVAAWLTSGTTAAPAEARWRRHPLVSSNSPVGRRLAGVQTR